METLPRYAFDVTKAYQRVDRAHEAIVGSEKAKKKAINILAKDWSGLVWEYGLKGHLRFTPYRHVYHQIFDFGENRFKMVDEDDFETRVDFLNRVDQEERGGFVYMSTQAMREWFLSSRVGDEAFLPSPRSDPGEDFSNYSFLYHLKVEETREGKKLIVDNYITDHTKEEFVDLLNSCSKHKTLIKGSSMEKVMTMVTDVRMGDVEGIWRTLVDSKEDKRIFNLCIDEILPTVNFELMDRVRVKSYQEAERLYKERIAGVPKEVIQGQMDIRLKNFVAKVLGVDYLEVTIENIGSCGIVSSNSEGIPAWVEYNSITGEFRCRLCNSNLKRSSLNSHRCVC